MAGKIYQLREGLRWRGRLRVLEVSADGVTVEFDAVDPAFVAERYVFDRALLTRQQFRDWTGEDP